MDIEIDLETPFKLAFDPATSDWTDEGVCVQQVWTDAEARMLFLAYSRYFLRSQYFLAGCLHFGKLVRKKKPRNGRDVLNIMCHCLRQDYIIGNDFRKLSDALYPYIVGHKQMTFEIKPEAKAAS
jgi:hypothetical protein